MKNNLEDLKRDTKKLLTREALTTWDFIEWDKEEVGNSIINFINIDPNTKPRKIADFINKKSFLIKNFNWRSEMKSKYKGSDIPLSEILNYRKKFVDKYGSKIVNKTREELSNEEVLAKNEYEILTNLLNKYSSTTFRLLDWFIETAKGRMVVYFGFSFLSFIAAILIVVYGTFDIPIFGIELILILLVIAGLLNLFKGLVILFKFAAKALKKLWNSVEV